MNEKMRLHNIMALLKRGKFELTGEEILVFNQCYEYLMIKIKAIERSEVSQPAPPVSQPPSPVSVSQPSVPVSQPVHEIPESAKTEPLPEKPKNKKIKK